MAKKIGKDVFEIKKDRAEIRKDRTEITDAILKSDYSNSRAIYSWLPPVYGEAKLFLYLLEAIGKELYRAESWTLNLQEQVVPQTLAAWALPYWEERYNIIPENEQDESEANLKKRRDAILAKKMTRLPMNPTRLEEYVYSVTGINVTVRENLGGDKYRFQVTMRAPELMIKRVSEVINKVKPAHLNYSLETKNWHSTLGEYKHELLGQYTHKELKNDKLNIDGPGNILFEQDYEEEYIDIREKRSIDLMQELNYNNMELRWYYRLSDEHFKEYTGVELALCDKNGNVCLRLEDKYTETAFSADRTFTVELSGFSKTFRIDQLISIKIQSGYLTIKSSDHPKGIAVPLGGQVSYPLFNQCIITNIGWSEGKELRGEVVQLDKLKIMKLIR